MSSKWSDYTAVHLMAKEKESIRKLARKITNIPKKFTTDNKLDLDKVRLALQDYQKA